MFQVRKNTLARVFRLGKELWNQHRMALSGFIILQVLGLYFTLSMLTNFFDSQRQLVNLVWMMTLIYALFLGMGCHILLKHRIFELYFGRFVHLLFQTMKVLFVVLSLLLVLKFVFSVNVHLWFVAFDWKLISEVGLFMLVVTSPLITKWSYQNLQYVPWKQELMLPSKVMGMLMVLIAIVFYIPYVLDVYNHLVLLALNSFASPMLFALIYLYNKGHCSQWDIQQKKKHEEEALANGYLNVPEFLRKPD